MTFKRTIGIFLAGGRARFERFESDQATIPDLITMAGIATIIAAFLSTGYIVVSWLI
jgi:hypothetical protein